ncbi:hypothetical protein MAHJHV63_50220 [Mycobacterium avium subsp. hominissuis]
MRHCAASTRCPPYVSTIAAMVLTYGGQRVLAAQWRTLPEILTDTDITAQHLVAADDAGQGGLQLVAAPR